MTIKELETKSNFISNEYTKLAKKINSEIDTLTYVHNSITNEEYVVIEYQTGYKKIINVTCDSLKAIVFDTIIKL